MLIPASELDAAMRIFRVPDRHGTVVPFRPNDAQEKYINLRTMFDIIYKSRQFGFSTFLELEGVIQCARYPQQHAVVIAHDRESTTRLFARVKFFLDDIARLGLEIPYKRNTVSEISFTDTNSTFYVGTAGSRKFGRGDTINFLHCSEVAFWPNPIETMGGLVPAARYGRKAIESTANGKGNYFHKICVKALKSATEEINDGFSKYVVSPRLHFYPWHEFAEYTLPGKYDPTDMTPEEIVLMKDFSLTLPQIAWRRQTLAEMPEDLLYPQEYPMTFDEGFLASGHSIFPKATLVPMKGTLKDGAIIYHQPESFHTYVAGIDSGGGTRRDFSVVEIFDAESHEQVAELAVNDRTPETFANMAVDLCKMYKTFVVPEVQFGLFTLEVFKKKYPAHLIYKRTKPDKLKHHEKQELFGLYATRTSKERIVSKGRAVIDGGAVIHSEFLKDQFDSFIEDENGQLHGESGCHDDAVIAFCLAMEGISQVKIPVRSKQPDTVSDVFQGYTWAEIRKRILKIHKAVHL